jgi:hypothetical protein
MIPIHFLALVIEAAGNIALAVFAAVAALALLRGQGPKAARLLLAEGGIGLKPENCRDTAKNSGSSDVDRIAAFAAILALRTVLKHVFLAEQRRLSGSEGRP